MVVLSDVLFAATDEKSDLAYWVPAAIGLGGAILGAFLAFWSGAKQRRIDRRHREEAFLRQQLNDFYSAIYMRRRKSESLRQMLSRDPAWRLVDHITDIHGGSVRDKELVEEIIKINSEIADLIVSKAGLYAEFPPPNSFTEFLEHEARLRICWQQKINQGTGERIVFPEDFDPELKRHIDAIYSRLGGLKKEK
jgi:hypothetical protein